jgi:hypothetical protein
MEWIHISDRRPDQEELIVRLEKTHGIERPHVFLDYWIDVVTYYRSIPWEDYLKELDEEGYPPPDFWWMPAKYFPLPKGWVF